MAPPTHPQKPLRLPFNPTPLPCSLSSSLSSRWKAWCGQGEAQEQMSAQSDHLEPVAPPHTCCLKAPSLPQTSLHPLSHLSLSRLLPHHSLPPLPHLPPAPLPRCAAAGLGQVDCRGAIPSPHGRRTLTVACRPPASVPPPLSSNWPEWPVWPAGATTHTGRLVMLLMETVFTGSADRYVAPINAADRNLQFQAATEKEEWHHPHLTTD